MSMRVLQISAVYKRGSVGKIVDCIHSRLLEKGHESFVCFGFNNGFQNTPREIRVCNKVDIFLSKLRYALFGLNLKGSYFGTKRIIRAIKRLSPDIVHIHCVNDYYLNQLMLFKFLKKKKIKTVLTMHCEHYYTGNCGYALQCEKWKMGGCDNNCYQFHLFSKYPLIDRSKKMFFREKQCFEGFDQNNLLICACTPWLKERAEQSIILKSFNNYKIVFNGANKEVYKYEPIYDRPNKIVVTYVTPRFEDKTKGSYKINDIARQFLDDDRFEFRIIGNVPSNFDFEKNIVLVGPKYGKDLAIEYSLANVNIMLSESECFPMVIVESLLCGTKVVAFECGGPDKCYSKEFVTFVKQNDFLSMKQAILNYVSQNYDKELISKKTSLLYSKEIMADNYLDGYMRLIENK